MRRRRGAGGGCYAATMRSSLAVLVLAVGPLAAGCISTSTEPTEPPCVPFTCEELRPDCGPALDDHCGHPLDCSACDAGKECVGGVCDCLAPPSCTSVRGIACGERTNVCGASIECGRDCPFGTTCDLKTGLCGTICDVADDCPGVGDEPGVCNLSLNTCQNDPSCDPDLCGSWQLDTALGPSTIACGCPVNRSCEPTGRCLCDVEAHRAVACEGLCGDVTLCDGSTMACDAARHASTVCDGRCGEVQFCDDAKVTCPACPLGVCEPGEARCREGQRPTRWAFDPTALLGAADFSGRAPQAVTAHRRSDGIELWVVAGHNGDARLYRVDLLGDGRTVRGPIVEATPPPIEYAYPYSSGPVVSLDGARLWILHGHSNASLPRLHVAEIDPITRVLAPLRPVAIGFDNVLAFVPFRDSRTALVATHDPPQLTVPDFPEQPDPPFAGRLYELGRYSTTPIDRGYPVMRGAWHFDEPATHEWVDEDFGNQIGTVQRGCDGRSITFDWVEGGILKGTGDTTFAGVLTLDPEGLPGALPVRPLPLLGLTLQSTETVSLSELAGCELAYIVTSVGGGTLHVAVPGL